MKPPLATLFVSCDPDATAAVLERLTRDYEPEFVAVHSRDILRRELRDRQWHLIFATMETELTPSLVLAECALAGKEIPVFVLCDASTENSALEAVRTGASDALRIDDLRRLLPALARELRTVGRRHAHPAGGRGKWALHETERHFHELFERTSDAVVIFAKRHDGAWVCETMNPACERAMGRCVADCRGHTATELISFGLPEELEHGFRTCEAGHAAVAREHAFDLPSGQRWFNTVLVPLPDERGLIERIACIARDTTEQHRAEAHLRETERGRLLHLQQTPLAAIEWDLKGRVVSWNPAAEKIFGYKAREALGHNFNFITPIDVRPYVDPVWKALIAQRGGTRSDNRNVRKDGVFIDCEWYNTPLIDESNRTIGVASLVQDVTESHAHQEAIRKLNAELESRVAERTAQLSAANRELGAFCYSVSHDLRAPLRAIDGFSKALLQDSYERLDAEGQDYLKRVCAASQRMARLIDDLLSLSRINRTELRRTLVDLGPIAHRIADGLQTSQPERQLEWTIAPSVIVRGDKNFLTILLENLFGNAFKYTTGRNPARIEFGSLDQSTPTTYFVADNGAGFDMSYADKLFQPFQRLHHAAEFEGHGIGLATAQRIVHRHGGRLWAEAAVGKGAAFFFTLEGIDHPPIGLFDQPKVEKPHE